METPQFLSSSNMDFPYSQAGQSSRKSVSELVCNDV